MPESAHYGCPRCDGRLRDLGAVNAWRCRRCSQHVVEVVDETKRQVREFYRRATERQWGGMR